MEKVPLKILAIGNSFSQDATAYLEPMAESAGMAVMVRNLCYPGCSLQQHYQFYREQSKVYDYEENGCPTDKDKHSLGEALDKECWDIVTLQQCSTNSGLAETYEPCGIINVAKGLLR